MKIVCCANMPYAREAFSSLGDVLVKDGRTITADDVCDARILAIRSTTKAGKELLQGSSVGFVGTATIGHDHMDTAWYDRIGIKWCYAPGCNANSVSEYVATALLCLARRHGFTLEGKTIGVIGAGNVGSRVVAKAEALGLKILKNDPPRQRAEGGGDFFPIEEVLAKSDIVTLHVPLTKDGPDKTLRMADSVFFARMKRGCIFINSARGPIVPTDALLGAMDKGIVAHAVVDTWEGEPGCRQDLLDRVDIGTPHIAGHSFDGKVKGTMMVYEEACRFLGAKVEWTPDAMLPQPLVPKIELDVRGMEDEAVLWELAHRVYDIEGDDRRLRECPAGDAAARAKHFDALRRNYPERRELRFTRVFLRSASDRLVEKTSRLGFKIA